jgi:hypothetical protein
MPISLSAETETLIEERMKETGVESPDDVVRLALEKARNPPIRIPQN